MPVLFEDCAAESKVEDSPATDVGGFSKTVSSEYAMFGVGVVVKINSELFLNDFT
jgi:hypothetical protein